MWVAAPILGFLLATVFHAALIRLLPGKSKLILFLFSGSLCGAVSIFLVAEKYSAFSIQTLGSASLFAFISELYIFLFSSVLTSISMNTLILIMPNAMTDGDLRSIYNGEIMVKHRLQRLINIGMIIQAPSGTLKVTDKGFKYLLFMKRLISFFKND